MLGSRVPCPSHRIGLAEAMDFQEHWQYEYLSDLDAAGFSRRFPLSSSRARSLSRQRYLTSGVTIDLRHGSISCPLTYAHMGREPL